ncbi:MAG: hypothetical protein Q8N05_11330 [Bacteroidota bacterium]|nr:hypothetical protein [Bacteroidota bacterium]
MGVSPNKSWGAAKEDCPVSEEFEPALSPILPLNTASGKTISGTPFPSRSTTGARYILTVKYS